MRRRSERKKSVEVCSPVTPASRRSRRSRKSPSLSESEKCVERSEEITKSTIAEEERTVVEERTTTSRRGTRRRTPVKERTISPVVKKSAALNAEVKCASEKIDVIPEEENGTTANAGECEGIQNDTAPTQTEVSSNDETVDAKEADDAVEVKEPEAEKENEEVSPVEEQEQEGEEEHKESEKTSKPSIESIAEEDMKMTAVAPDRPEEEKPEVAVSDPTPEENVDKVDNAVSTAAQDEDVDTEQRQQQQQHDEEEQTESTVVTNTPEATESVPQSEEKSANHEVNLNESCTENARTRKRKWITKKTTDNKSPILAISTDSLKNLIADVQPVPLSDVKLDSSPEVEEVPSEMEDGEEPSSPDRQSDREDDRIRDKTEDKERERRISSDAASQEKPKRQQKQNDVDRTVQQQQQHNHHDKSEQSMLNSPSPARNVSSSILYITNLVRPFTVLQLKGLLARTGKIVEDGFWIDRIKSKCYVKYETEDEAVETRHALHGVRWPVSNPKCLNVEFGLEADMNKAIESTKEETTKTPQENYRENIVVGSGWSKERHEEDSKAKSARHVREWDVGKKENADREKPRDHESRRSRDRDVSGGRTGDNERNGKERKPMARGRDLRSSSLSPVRKIKKTEEPPLRLLDDLFRKTKATPCIYWLPLTPEQIAEKEAFRQKRIEEQKERIKQRELDKEKEREKGRNERTDRDRGRDRDHRRNVSNERRRSRSRDRRRY